VKRWMRESNISQGNRSQKSTPRGSNRSERRQIWEFDRRNRSDVIVTTLTGALDIETRTRGSGCCRAWGEWSRAGTWDTETRVGKSRCCKSCGEKRFSQGQLFLERVNATAESSLGPLRCLGYNETIRSATDAGENRIGSSGHCGWGMNEIVTRRKSKKVVCRQRHLRNWQAARPWIALRKRLWKMERILPAGRRRKGNQLERK
jgi:hypothetical protein